MNEASCMNALVIAGGFGTRMGGNLPKGLISLNGGRTILERMLLDLSSVRDVGRVAVTTNGVYRVAYEQWLPAHGFGSVILLSNGVSDPANRLGAIGDIVFALKQLSWEHQDLLVLPSDTLYGFSLQAFIRFAQKKDGVCVVANRMDTSRIAKRLGCLSLTEERVVGFEEKPAAPESEWAVVPFYSYPKRMIPHLMEYYDLYRNERAYLDAPSQIISWLLARQIPVYAFRTNEGTLDVGRPEDIDSPEFAGFR